MSSALQVPGAGLRSERRQGHDDEARALDRTGRADAVARPAHGRVAQP